MRHCLHVAEKGLRASITDAGVGGLMGRAGVLGAIYNVKINLPQIKDREWVAEIRSKLADLVEEAGRLERQICDLVEEEIDREG